MLTDTMYELALRELSDLTDPAREMLDAAARSMAACAAVEDHEEEERLPPGPCGQT